MGEYREVERGGIGEEVMEGEGVRGGMDVGMKRKGGEV